jgi:CBS domain-containing protein
MLVHEVMSSTVITLRPTDTVRQAIRVLYDNHITSAPVLGDHGELVGVVSEIDLLCGALERDPRADPGSALLSEPAPRRVADVMTRDVATVTETTDAAVLVDLMINKRVKSVPVLGEEGLLGMVSRRDLMAKLAGSDAALREAVVAALREQYPGGPYWEVTVRDGEVELHGHAGDGLDSAAEQVVRTVPGVARVRHA